MTQKKKNREGPVAFFLRVLYHFLIKKIGKEKQRTAKLSIYSKDVNKKSLHDTWYEGYNFYINLRLNKINGQLYFYVTFNSSYNNTVVNIFLFSKFYQVSFNLNYLLTRALKSIN